MKKILIPLFILLILFNVPFVDRAIAYFSNTITVLNNNFSAGTLDFSLTDENNNIISGNLFNTKLIPDTPETKTVVVKNSGTLGFKYNMSAEKTGGDDDLCHNLQLEVKLDGISKYNGSLLGLTLSPEITLTGTDDTWNLSVRLDSDDPMYENKSCQFKIKYFGYQENSDGTWGFTDTEELTNNIYTGDFSDPDSTGTNLPLICTQELGVNFYTQNMGRDVGFDLINFTGYDKADYQITYDTDKGQQGMIGSIDLTAITDKSSYTKNNLFLGTCTSGGTCTPHTGITTINLQVLLTQGPTSTTLNKQITL